MSNKATNSMINATNRLRQHFPYAFSQCLPQVLITICLQFFFRSNLRLILFSLILGSIIREMY